MIRDFTDTSTELVVDTPSGLPSNLRHALNVLAALGLKEDSVFLALLDACVSVDPLHIARMARAGALQPYWAEPFSVNLCGTELHLSPERRTDQDLPAYEVVVCLATNDARGVYFHRGQGHYLEAGVPFNAREAMGALAEVPPGKERLERLAAMLRAVWDAARSAYASALK